MSKVYIEKAAFKAMLDKRIYCLCGGETVKETKNIRDLLEAFPPADVKPVMRGEWRISCAGGDAWADCPCCSNYVRLTFEGITLFDSLNGLPDFCPNCGADMRKEENDER